MPNFWFPVAPGVTQLPAAPATGTMTITGVNDQGQTVTLATLTTMTASALVKPYNEAVNVAPTTRTKIVVASYPYSLTQQVTTLALTSKTKLVVASIGDPVRVNSTAVPVLGAGQVTPATATGAGWSKIYDSTSDEGKTQITGIPFNITVNSTAYTGVWVTSNSYLTFADAAVEYQSLGAGTPNVPKLHIGSDDFSYQRIYTKSETNVYRIRWEGNSAYGAAAGNSNRFLEVNFWKPPTSGTQFIEVRVGNISGGTSGPFMLATASTSLASGTFAANESFVFEGNADGTTWTLYTGQHVE